MRKILLLFLFQIISIRMLAAVFVVTSNADSGPNTLRQAMLDAAANGSTDKDYINFNITDQSEAGRTIILQSQLPDVSSNLVIDGTTQTGAIFGQSDARIELSSPYNNIPFTILNGLGIANVEIYGLYIHDWTGIITSRPATGARIGLRFINCSNITIGAVNKGNLIRGYNQYSLYFENTDIIVLKSNIVGLNSKNDFGDDLDAFGQYENTASITIIKSNNITLGGNGNEGNIIFCYVDIQFYEQTTNNNLIIKGNNLGVFKDGTTTAFIYQNHNYINIKTIYSNDFASLDDHILKSAKVNLNIENNLAGSFGTVFGIQFIDGSINFYNNYLGVARDGTSPVNKNSSISSIGQSINLSFSMAQINIGGADPAQKNFFGYMRSAVITNGSSNVLLKYNNFQCISETPYIQTNPAQPTVAIDNMTVNGTQTTVNGTATSLSTIDIYSSESCQSICNIHSYMQSVTADNTGKWQANILNLNGIFYVSATLNNITSVYKTLQVNNDNVNIQDMRCNDNAVISGLKVPAGVNYYWIDSQGNIISHDLNLITNKAGEYRFVLGDGCITSNPFKINDNRLNIYDGSVVKTMPGCGNANGGIKNLSVYDPLNKLSSIIWTDGNGTDIGHTANISGLRPGIYTLTVKSSDGCTATYGPVTLTNTTGPNIDQTTATINSTPCGLSTGSITGISATGTGTLKYSWKNAQNQQVATTKDLINQPAGIYTLQVTDDTNCGPVYTSAIEILETNSINMTDNGTATPASCTGGNGAVTGITVAGATKYQWYDQQHNAITGAIAADLTAALPGSYYLVASNATCAKQSKIYTITRQTNNIDYAAAIDEVIIPAGCGLNNGSIVENINSSVAGAIKSFRWVEKATGRTIGGNSNTITGLDAGAYQFYITDNNGCEKLVTEPLVIRISPLEVITSGVNVTNESCGQNNGRITGIQYGGFAPIIVQWTNAAGKNMGSSGDLLDVPGGIYTIKVTDGLGCTQSFTYTVDNLSSVLNAPGISDVQLCSPGDAMLTVNNISAGYGYRLYDSPTSVTPLDDEKSGRFKINITNTRSYFISQYTGACESSRAEAKVSVVGLLAVGLPNTFSPNGDGINDTWKISGIENYPNASVQLFTRSGEKVFDSVGYAVPFNGTYKGQSLPIGTYYYIINLNSGCSLLSGSLTLIR